ncbi:MAG: head-tail adaptor protein [Eubacteriales bacterium]
MSFGKLNVLIEILSPSVATDSEGFYTGGDITVANIRAYKEDRHGSEKWANRASFSNATVLFRFRSIPNLTITTKQVIVCGGERYNITSVEDIKDRGMYIQVLAVNTEVSQDS